MKKITLTAAIAGFARISEVSSVETIRELKKSTFLEISDFSKMIAHALHELDLSETLLPRVREVANKKGFWNYFQILDLLKFNISKKVDGLRYIQVKKTDDEIILNNISVEEFNLGHINADTIHWSSVDHYGHEIEFNSPNGVYNKITEIINGDEQVYLFPKTNLEKILAF